ncbi:MAG: TldD/PmbA family protein [Candidatus Polarisedimenticolia bacterium]
MMETAAALLDRCHARGASYAEAWIKTGATRAVTLEAGGGVSWSRSAEGGVALRAVTADGRAGFASACGLEPSERTADALAAAALETAGSPWPAAAGPLPSGRLPDGRGFGIFDPRLHTATCSDLEGLLDDAASEALRTEPRVRRLESACVTASSSEVWIATSAGLTGTYRQTLLHVSLGVVAGVEGGSVVVRRTRTARSLSAFSPALFGDETARLAATELEGRPARAGIFPVLLAPVAAAELLRLAARTLVMTAARIGARVGPARLTLIDDGRLPGGVSTAPFDGEGVATRRTTLVARGQAASTVHDLDSAAREGAASTGNGLRASFRDPPRRATSNLFITPGNDAPEDLLAEMRGERAGLWIQSLRPTAALLQAEGTVAALAAGRWVDDGTPGAPVAGTLVMVPLDAWLDGIVGVGNDLMFGCTVGSFGSPSLLVRQMELRPA